MILAALDRLAALATQWRATATERRTLTAVDPGADTLEHCARQLEGEIESVRRSPRAMRVADFAAIVSMETGRQVPVTTVRRWIRQGMVPATRVGRDYLIPADARPSKKAA